ncbi:BamA/TamA family outer membrane protein [candidate division KSB1 bacterium]|nr:BamA/TamA family outer membrane protein [candidate division KSB1 bacterium]
MKNTKLATIFLIFLFKSITGFCQQDTTRISITNLKISGNSQISAKEIRKVINHGEYSKEQLKSAIENLLKIYQQKSFYFTQTEFKDTAKVSSLFITEGQPLLLRSINLNCADSLLLPGLQSRLDLRGREQISETISDNFEILLQYLENNGYPFCKISIDSLKIEAIKKEALLDCFANVLPGAFVVLDSIHIVGNELTRENVIVRETRLKNKSVYNHQQVLRIPERLMKTGFFNRVEVPEIKIDKNGRGFLFIKLKEGNPNQLNAVFGYNPSTDINKKGYITGLIDIGFTNLLGTGRIVEAYWRKKDQKSQELKFRYVEPWIRGYPITAGIGFQQTIQDTSFVRRTWGLDVDVPFSDILTIQSHIGKENVLPDSIGQILYQLPKSSSWIVKIGFAYDSRDNLWNPSRGVYYGTHYEFARKQIVSLPDNIIDASMTKGTFRRDRWTVDGELYVPTFKWQTILLGLHWRQVKSNERNLSIADLFRLGGTGSIRGYREDEFFGEKTAWLNLEYRYLLGNKSRVFLFMDGGYFANRNYKNKLEDNYKFSYGFGLRLETRLGTIGVDYGLGEGRGLTSGLVHIGLMNKF